MWPVERRIDLCAIEPARVALEMRASRVEARRRRARNRPARRPNPDVCNLAMTTERLLVPARAANRPSGPIEVSAVGH